MKTRVRFDREDYDIAGRHFWIDVYADVYDNGDDVRIDETTLVLVDERGNAYDSLTDEQAAVINAAIRIEFQNPEI